MERQQRAKNCGTVHPLVIFNPTRKETTMVNPTDRLYQALANLWAGTRPKTTDVLVRNLRAHAYSYAMDDPKLCEDLRQAIGRLEHPSALEPKPLSIIDRLDAIVQDLHGLGLTQVGGEIDQLLIAHIEALRGAK
jgi:hypothetical protein